MDAVFLEIIRLSIASCWFIVAVIAVRGVFRDMPKGIRCVLWELVGIRLLCPCTFRSRFSLIPDVDRAMNRAGIIYAAGFPVERKVAVLEKVWIAGVAVFLIFAVINYIKLRQSVSEAVRFEDNICICDRVQVPFTVGVICPKIYLPSDLSGRERDHVLLHERAHIRRRDQIRKYLSYIVLAIHWFNPLVWAACLFFDRDMELSCDAGVIRDMDEAERKSYAESLLSRSMQRKAVISYFPAFGGASVKERVEEVVAYRRTTKRALIGSVAVCLAAVLCFLTKPFPDLAGRVWVNTGVDPSEPTKTVTFETKAEKDRTNTVNIVAKKAGPYVYLYFHTDYDDAMTEYHVSFDDIR